MTEPCSLKNRQLFSRKKTQKEMLKFTGTQLGHNCASVEKFESKETLKQRKFKLNR